MRRFLSCLKVLAAPIVFALSLFIIFACRAGLSRLPNRSSADRSIVDAPIRAMSDATVAALQKFDAATAIQKRCANFTFLHERLQTSFSFALVDDDVPMVYPYVTDDRALRSRLIANKIFVAKYWPQLSPAANALAERIIPLPVDQRYGTDDMKRIVEAIYG